LDFDMSGLVFLIEKTTCPLQMIVLKLEHCLLSSDCTVLFLFMIVYYDTSRTLALLSSS